MKKSLYSPFGRFVLRTPLFPLAGLSDRGTLLSSPVFREAVRLASPELASAEPKADAKKRWKYENSLLKYFHRSCTRSTPFGLFAGCTVGRFGDGAEIELFEAPHWRRCTRLDMQYLCALIQHVERMPRVRSRLLFYPNDSLYELGGSLRYVEYRYEGSRRIHQVSSVEQSEYLAAVLTAAAGGERAERLAETVAADGISIQEASGFIEELIEAQVLKSELDPCVVGPDVLTALIDRLSALGEDTVLETLKEIREMLRRADESPIGTAGAVYDAVTDKIKGLGVGYEAKFLFQTDLFKPARKAVLPAAFAERLSRLVQFLAGITAPYPQTRLSAFKDAFSARYEEREIPLAEALDVELGIGYPVRSGNAPDGLVAKLALPSRQASGKMQAAYDAVDIVLLRRYAECLQGDGRSIVLTDSDFKNIHYTHALPDTLAVMCSVSGDDPEKCSVYIRSVGGSTAASLLGRFCHLDPDMESLVREIARAEAEAQPDKLVAEISHLPESRIGNIASRPSVRECTVHYLSGVENGAMQLPLSDLVLSVRGGRLFLRSLKYDKEVLPRLTCAHNYGLSPIPAYLFLCDMQTQGVTAGFGLRWNELMRHADYLPRVEYEGFVLSRRRWTVRRTETEAMDGLPDEELCTAVARLRESRGLPRQVVVADSDNELYFDLGDAGSVKMLLDMVRKRGTVGLEEFLFEDCTSPVVCGGQAYANEFIVPFKKN